VLRKLGHGREINVFDVGKGNLGVVAKMPLQLTGVVIARQIKIAQPWNYSVVNDLDDVGLLLILGHSVDNGPIFGQGRQTETFAIALHHFRQVEINFVTRPVLNQRQSVSILDLTAHGWDAHGGLGTAPDSCCVFRAAGHLHPPKPQPKRPHPP
jgi:hypothetical protein